jgi:lysophospholipid acyltransferase (LPLAT)-like uncharacterized protein
VKNLFRAAWLQAALAAVLAAYLNATLRTIRWRQENLPSAEAIWDAGGPVIVCFWHSRIAISPACWPLDRAQEPRALISLSADGEFIAKAMEKVGFPAIRGSASKRSDQTRAKGGAAAFRDVLRWLKAGNGIAITPDGPRGPVEQMTDGPAMLAKVSRAPVLLVGMASKPNITLNTWDRHGIPLPFTKGAIVWRGPFRVAADDDVEALAKTWAGELSDATRAAEAMLG